MSAPAIISDLIERFERNISSYKSGLYNETQVRLEFINPFFRDVISIKCNNEAYHPFYLLGILNSYLISWFHRKINPKSQKGLFPKVLVSDLKKTPVTKINSSNNLLVTKLVQNVDSIIKLFHSLDNSKTPQEKTALQRQIEATDKQIDQLVYQLYGLTEEEIEIVEENNN
ncbi:MAG: hypothetical protein A2V93_01085 [Ignavibacteria bacterium RBG_16_34_14]|nr:MAG: hypothetical protein A2V93_01085 [Ignavibacteria bacterium RBG_16_34_14]